MLSQRLIRGDKFLQGIGAVLGDQKRLGDVAARYGGDEFVMLLPDTTKGEAIVLAERIRAIVGHKIIHHGNHLFRGTISGGIATYPEEATDDLELIHCADLALYKAKPTGKNAVRFYKPDNYGMFLNAKFRVITEKERPT